MDARLLWRHGNMNGLAYQVLHAKKMKKFGKDFKPIFGVEAYFIPSVDDWRVELERYKADKKLAKQIDKDQSGTNIENEGASKRGSSGLSAINHTRHLILLAMNETGLQNIFKLVSESYNGDYYYRKPRIDFALLERYNEGVIALSLLALVVSMLDAIGASETMAQEAVMNCMPHDREDDYYLW